MPGDYSIKAEQWESYWLSRNSCGVADSHEDNAVRVAEILSQSYPGILFLWDDPGPDGMVMISAIRPDKRKLSASLETKITNAARRIVENVANKYPPKPRPFFGWFHKPLRPGWHFTEKK
jgi:hypothetical protein